MVLSAVKEHMGSSAVQVLADAGYRSEAVMAELVKTQPDTELVIALGREGKVLAKPRDAQRYPHTVAMAPSSKQNKEKLTTANASGLPSHPTAGSKTFWGFASSACVGY